MRTFESTGFPRDDCHFPPDKFQISVSVVLEQITDRADTGVSIATLGFIVMENISSVLVPQPFIKEYVTVSMPEPDGNMIPFKMFSFASVVSVLCQR